jgi:hypothetical protein
VLSEKYLTPVLVWTLPHISKLKSMAFFHDLDNLALVKNSGFSPGITFDLALLSAPVKNSPYGTVLEPCLVY